MPQESSEKEQGKSTDSGTEGTSYRVLSDMPATSADRDYLDFLPYAMALATLMDRKATATPLIAAISAPWGAGKTTLSELVQEQLRVPGDWDDPHIICRFDAWKHDDAPNLGAAFASEVAQQANRYRRWWRRLIQPIPPVMLTPEQRWRRKCYIILTSLAIAIGLVLGAKTRALITAAAHPTSNNWTAAEHAVHGWAASLLIVIAALIFVYPKILTGAQSVARFITDPQSEAAQGSMNSVREQLGNLIRSATRKNRRFIIFVDDLERCRPPRAIEVCEVASQLLDHPGIIVVLVGDMEAIAMSAAIKYRNLEIPENSQGGSNPFGASYAQYGRSYLQKIVTIQFDLPPATPGQLKNMLQANLRVLGGANQNDALLNTSKIRQWIAPLVYYIVVGGILIGILISNVVGSGGNLTKGLSALVATAAGGIAGVVIPIIVERLRRTRTRTAREQADQAIQDQSIGTTVDEAAENAMHISGGPSADVVRKRYLSAVLDTTEIAARADSLVFDFLPNRPRGAKRLLNQVRLMILIAAGRGLFVLRDEGNQDKQADLIGKWLVLRERWPEVAQLAQRDPEQLKALEDSATHDELKLSSLMNSYEGADLDDLQRLLKMKPYFENLSELTFFSGNSSGGAHTPIFDHVVRSDDS